MSSTTLRQTVFSPCRRYRYALWRKWDARRPAYALFIGLNPSTADEVTDDPTLRRCVGFAKAWGYDAVCVANLFALRETDPAELKKHPEPVGDDNDRWLKALARSAEVVIAAWGVHGGFMGRDRAVRCMLAGKLSYLALSKGGQPRHPLYLPKGLRPQSSVALT